MKEWTTFRLNDFLGNAGIIGLLKLLHKIDPWEEHYKIGDTYLEVETKFLLETDLTQAYFDTLIEEYQEECPYHRILNQSKFLISEPDKESKDFLKQLKAFKKDLESNRYKTGYESIKENIELPFNLYEEMARLLTLTKAEEIEQSLTQIDQILNYGLVKETFFMKDIAYFVINNFWEGKSFLNRNNAKKDMKEVHKKEIEEILKQYLVMEPKKGKICVECGDEISGAMGCSSSFVNDFSEDFARKNSNYWNFIPNCYFCPKCLFLYTLIPLGFTKIGNNFLFINSNQSLELLRQVNSQKIINKQENQNSFYLYNQVLQSLNNENLKRISNIQVITRQGLESRYRFDIINQQILNLLFDCRKELEQLAQHDYIKDVEGYRNIYEEVLIHLLYNQELYRLLNELLLFSLNTGNEYVIHSCRLIYQIEERRRNMVEEKKYYFITKEGNEYRKAMEINGKDDATIGISYKMLNALKSQDCYQFLDIIIRLSNGLKRKVPTDLINTLKNMDEFKRFGYAFVLGFRGGYYEGKNNQEETDKMEQVNNQIEKGGEQ